MVEIVPTVTAYSPAEYKQQLETACALSQRISLDFMDGVFTPAKNINLIQAYYPPNVLADIHLMYQQPLEHIETLISMKPHLVVVHAEASGDLASLLVQLKGVGIKTGLAFLANTAIDQHQELIAEVDHALVFSGLLGKFGGKFNSGLLGKVDILRAIKPQLEISWDGGVNESNAAQLAQAGLNVLNVGGYLQKASDPQSAYDTLKKTLEGSN